MLRRNLFVVVVLLGLILSAAFTSWTQDTSAPGKSAPPPASSWPPDTTNYSRPATAADVVGQTKGLAGFSSPGFFVVEVPDSPGGEPDIAINPLHPNQIVIHAGFGGWPGGNAPNAVSNDGGIAWTTVNQIPPPTGITVTGGPGDITQDYGLDGNLYGTYLTGVPPGAFCIPISANVFSASNTNPIFGGLFNYFTIAGFAQRTDFNGTAGCSDQPWLLTNVDPTTPGQTNTYVGYDNFEFFPIPMRVSVALGTQPPNFTVDNPSGLSISSGINPGHRLANDPRTGAMYSLYQNCVANCGTSFKTIDYILNRSLDAGATWTLNGNPLGVTVATGVTVQPTPKFGTVNALLGGIDHAAVNPTTGDVFVVFGASNGTGGNEIRIQHIGFVGLPPTTAGLVGPSHLVSLPPLTSLGRRHCRPWRSRPMGPSAFSTRNLTEAFQSMAFRSFPDILRSALTEVRLSPTRHS